jgi:hypothetical protein
VFEGRAVWEGGVDESGRSAVDLARRERPQLDDLHASRQRVGQIP